MHVAGLDIQYMYMYLYLYNANKAPSRAGQGRAGQGRAGSSRLDSVLTRATWYSDCLAVRSVQVAQAQDDAESRHAHNTQ